MKKNGNWIILILIVSLAIFGLYLGYAKIINDTTPPVVTCDSEEITVSVTATQQELLAGVTAEDKRSGDVTDSLVVESISAFAGDERIIVYAAVDERGNVGRAQRVLKYTDYEAPKFELDGPLRYSIGSSTNLLKNVRATSTLDGDLTGNVKYSLVSGLDTSSEGEYKVEYRVTDSTGTVSYLPVEVEIYNPLEEGIHVTLTDYLIYLPKGSGFDANSYYEGASSGGSLDIDSDVDTDVEGVYTVEYTVSDGYDVGSSRLVVVVTGE